MEETGDGSIKQLGFGTARALCCNDLCNDCNTVGGGGGGVYVGDFDGKVTLLPPIPSSNTDTNTVGNVDGAEQRGVRCAFFEQKFTLEDAIEFHAFAPLEVLPCV
jgi:hypothetical protein